MILDRVLFLAAYTPRSQAYAQAMVNAGMEPDNVLLFGRPPSSSRTPALPDLRTTDLGDLFLPDFREPLEATCSRAGWSIRRSPADGVNHPDVAAILSELRPRTVLYSGYGGQLVSPQVLDLGIDFLHLHAGWLPDFPGSTTIYYSWIKERRCGVTALLLDKNIDSGPIVGRRHYPVPPRGLDVDHLYDGAIRADLLVRVLRDFGTRGRFSAVTETPTSLSYYVIHPILKHLALLSQDTEGSPPTSTPRKNSP